ncbi:divalent-cation tolerance protein CutA [Jiangella asiatica]|uniref:Divalent-cation tolerance protein CutA n=1 Tax=Jiangella asiatica TaxID=2530372 RepID=A0A4R5CRM8_9ACTN|nr:divalent-cation tolerance protein CutA [Jiangella asiatica]TDE01481.1 divalent-cation tolerance protein CutA [Jiangella asiatica]
MDAEHVVVITTTDSEAAARELAAGVVAGRLGACAQIIPITSVYRWEGVVRTEPEWRLEIKTVAGRADALIEYLAAMHGYDVPEIVVVQVAGGSAAYLSWVSEETS